MKSPDSGLLGLPADATKGPRPKTGEGCRFSRKELCRTQTAVRRSLPEDLIDVQSMMWRLLNLNPEMGAFPALAQTAPSHQPHEYGEPQMNMEEAIPAPVVPVLSQITQNHQVRRKRQHNEESEIRCKRTRTCAEEAGIFGAMGIPDIEFQLNHTAGMFHMIPTGDDDVEMGMGSQ